MPAKTHGMSQTRFYRIWQAMIQRCYVSTHPVYSKYGAKGISVCEAWKGDNGFINFMSDMFPTYLDNLTLDRINNKGNYESNNCRWATRKIQSNNISTNRLVTLNGETHTLSEWAEKFNIRYNTIVSRLFHGWTEQDALTKPINNHNYRSIKYRNKTITLKEFTKFTTLSYTRLRYLMFNIGLTVDEIIEKYGLSEIKYN